jgi:hypothetical protein
LVLRAPRHRISFVHGTFDSTTFALKGKLTSLKAALPNARRKIRFWRLRPVRSAGKRIQRKGSAGRSDICRTAFRRRLRCLCLWPFGLCCIDRKIVEYGRTVPFPLVQAGHGRRYQSANCGNARRAAAARTEVDRFRANRTKSHLDAGTRHSLEFVEPLRIAAPLSCRTRM